MTAQPSQPERPSRRRTGAPDVDARLRELLDTLDISTNRDQLLEILVTVVGMATDSTDRYDLKITNAALQEMREAFRVFAPYRDVPKVTMFGSARTREEDPLYTQARDLAGVLAGRGWMVITGAGPGIMAAGMEGAGRDMSFGINIRLPFEQGANEIIAEDPKLVEMKYFFTRKLMLMKESDGFVVLPGGFGTLDESFELLTLVQTGKTEPSPIVLLEVPGGTYWHRWHSFLADEVAGRGLISEEDHVLYRITDDVTTAAEEIFGFYRNYHSRRFVGDRLVLRLRAAPTPDELDRLNDAYADICVTGRIEAVDPLPAELSTDDHVHLPRIALHFDRLHHGRLRQLIDTINTLDSAPPELLGPAERELVAGGRPDETLTADRDPNLRQ